MTVIYAACIKFTLFDLLINQFYLFKKTLISKGLDLVQQNQELGSLNLNLEV